jgi:hypothetical protein
MNLRSYMECGDPDEVLIPEIDADLDGDYWMEMQSE